MLRGYQLKFKSYENGRKAKVSLKNNSGSQQNKKERESSFKLMRKILPNYKFQHQETKTTLVPTLSN